MTRRQGPLLNQDKLTELLIELGQRCAAKGIEVEMYMVGDAAMALVYGRDRVTRDIDAIFEPKMVVYEEARRMAAERGLPPDWLNDAVKGLLPDRPDPNPRTVLVAPGISVSVASAEYLFAMKAVAGRQEGDSADLITLAKFLNVTKFEEGLAIVERFHRPERLQVHTSLFVRSVLEGTN